MNDVLFDYLDVFYTVYLDNILIYSKNSLIHKTQVKKVLECLRKAGIQANIKKYEFSVTCTKYLGFIISTDGISVNSTKIEVIKNQVLLKTVRSVQLYLGFCNFYQYFIRDYGKITRPFVQLTQKENSFDFNDHYILAFNTLK